MMRSAAPSIAPDDSSWSSTGLQRRDAIRQWQEWAARTIAPIDVSVLDTDRFAARWRSHGLGPLRLLHLNAPAQRVVHRGSEAGSGTATPAIQLVYARRGTLNTRAGHDAFPVGPGEFVLLDNSRFYQMDMSSPHEAVDLMMPLSWLERRLPDPERMLARPISARSGWGAPLGSLIEAMARGVGDSPLPRAMIAEQVGALLMLATGNSAAPPNRHRVEITRRILRHIHEGFADAELAPERICGELGISRRHMQALLAARGTSFVQELTATRLDRAGAMLLHQGADGLPIGEVAFRCGFVDAGYFARQFRRRFGMTPRRWRQDRPAC